MRKRKTNKPRVKAKAAKTAKGCICNPPSPEFPLSKHLAICPVRRRYSTNGAMIAELLHVKKQRGNVRDYVIISGYRLIDHAGTHDIKLPDGRTVGVEGVVLVHKSKLKGYLGDEAAAKFWRGGRRRIDHGDG